MTTRSRLALLALLSLSGCLAVDPEPSLDRVRSLNDGRSDTEIVWQRSPEEADDVRARIDTMLVDGLTRDESTRIAVLNNPGLQAQLAELGIASADLVEASLLKNPVLDFYWASPRRTGDSSIGLVGWLSDLWTLPRRKQVAEAELRRVEFEVALQVMLTAQRATQAFDQLVQAREQLELARSLLGVRQTEAARRQVRFAHGLDSTGLLGEVKLRAAHQDVSVREREQLLSEAETEFTRLLGLDDAADQVPPEQRLPAYPVAEFTLTDVLAEGLRERLDLATAEAEVERQSRRLGLEEVLVWESVAVGVGREGVFTQTRGDEDSLGALVSIDLPIFDQNQAGTARARFAMEQSIQRLLESRQRALKELSDSFNAYQRSQQILETLTEQALPAAEESFEYRRRWNMRMQISYVERAESEAMLLEIRMATVRARLMVNESWRGLQLAMRGGAL